MNAPSPLRWLLTALLVPLAALLFAAGHYAVRGVGYSGAASAGLAPAQFKDAMLLSQLAALGGAVLGGLAVAALGAGAVTAAGWGFAALAALVLAFGPFDAWTAGMLALGGAVGLARPSLWAIAARGMPPGNAAAIAAVLVGAYAAVNGGAMVASFVSPFLDASFGPALPTAVGAALLGVAAVVALGVGAAQHLLPKEPEIPGSAEVLSGPHVVSALVATLVGSALVTLTTWVVDLSWTRTLDQMATGGMPLWMGDPLWIYQVNPVIVTAACAALAVGATIAAIVELRLPLLTLAALGGALTAAGGLALTLGETLGPGAFATILTSLLLQAFGEVLLVPLLAARATAGVHWRAAGLLTLPIVLATALPSLAMRAFPDDLARGALPVVSSVTLFMAVLVGVAAAILDREAIWFPPQDSEGESAKSATSGGPALAGVLPNE